MWEIVLLKCVERCIFVPRSESNVYTYGKTPDDIYQMKC